MSEDTRTQKGQAGSAVCTDTDAGTRQEPQTFIRESIKYRRRAQEAERRAEALEAEIEQLGQAGEEQGTAVEAELAAARAEAGSLRARLNALERDRRLERELARAGCEDIETGLVLARARLAEGDLPADPEAFVRRLIEEKPHLRGNAVGSVRTLPPPTAGPKPAGPAPRRAVERLADQARRTGNSKDLMAYMRARRGAAI